MRSVMKTLANINIKADLCMNCVNHTECVFELVSEESIIQCENYEIETWSKEQNLVPIIQPSKHSTFLGLCSNCDNAESCNLISADSIIFTCEEYK
jgi:hypothetical protein